MLATLLLLRLHIQIIPGIIPQRRRCRNVYPLHRHLLLLGHILHNLRLRPLRAQRRVKPLPQRLDHFAEPEPVQAVEDEV